MKRDKSTSLKDIAVYGAGGFGREVLTLINDINQFSPEYRFIGFFDDTMNTGETVNGYPMLGGLEKLNLHAAELSVVIAVGSPSARRNIYSRINNPRIVYPSLIHPSVCSNFGDRCISVGKGCIICAGSLLTCNIAIEDFTIINLSCTVGHDTSIGKFSSFMPGVNISGEVLIGEEVYVGTGAAIINRIEIGKETVIGAGAVVSQSLPSRCTAVGIPARPIKFH